MAQTLTTLPAGKLAGLYQPAFAAALRAAVTATPRTDCGRTLLTDETMRARCARFIAPPGSAHR